ncbi:MAG: hypothetical protein CMM47_09850 [Rhodospirillaceae bacterium]|nr:hypothetical protein [Rhodospirillaceae bacterium]
MNGLAFDIAFNPLIPWILIGIAGGLGLAILGWGSVSSARGSSLRLAALVALLLAISNPTLVEERRETKPDVAVIVVDRTPSQMIGDRPNTTESTLKYVTRALDRMPNMEVRLVRLRGGPLGTRLFKAVSRAVSDIPNRRLAGVIAITDGQVHDAGTARVRGDVPVPFHVILTGERDESDRLLKVVQSPSFGLVGRDAAVTIRVEDTTLKVGSRVPVTMRIDGGERIVVSLPANSSQQLKVPMKHAGETVVELLAEVREGELGDVNNRAVLAINGVRDRLRVLLVSGIPHAGERTWRNLLKADPSVDLVHFTILRPPQKQDGTPIRELSLIAFPVRELFEVKLDEFDLIVFDRYRRRGVLPRTYLSNIVDYVRKGGALLEASGPTFATRLSLSRSPLGEILPGRPTGNVIEKGYRPRITDLGFRHPVTSGLKGGGRLDAVGQRLEEANWGRWLRQVEADPIRGSVLIDGINKRPILLLDRVGKGRIAHLLSDHIWLWSRGFEGGGPQAEMLRRLAHWLMKEPDLEEKKLQAVVNGTTIELYRHSLETDEPEITMTRPDGTTETLNVSIERPGLSSARFQTDQVGLHQFTDGEMLKLVAVGAPNPAEFSDLRASERILGPLSEASGGGVHWAADGLPGIRRVGSDRTMAGRDWIGLKANEDYVVTGVETHPLMPGFLVLVMVIGLATAAWWREAG